MRYSQRGLLAAAAAFIAWGLLPLFWKQLSEEPAMKVLAHRVLWSFLFLAGFQLLSGRVFRCSKQSLSLSAILAVVFSGALITGNWLLYVLAVNSGNVLESSLGYFINPLFIVFLGAVFCGERLRGLQLVALSVAALGVFLCALSYGRLPFYALGLAGSMGLYALMKKSVPLGSLDSLSLEMSTVVAPAALYLTFLPSAEGATEVGFSLTSFLLVSTGIITIVPLLWFAFAAKNLPMYALGLMQYLAPSLQFLLAVFVFGEAFEPTKALAFALIWSAIALFLYEGALHKRAEKRQAQTWREQIVVPQEEAIICSRS